MASLTLALNRWRNHMDIEKNKILILTQTAEEDTRAVLPSIGRRITTTTFEMANNVLADRLEEFFNSFQAVLERLPASTAGFSIDEIELTLTVNASGGIEMVGKAEAGISTGMKFTLKRKNNQT
jgi:hypothetical protein